MHTFQFSLRHSYCNNISFIQQIVKLMTLLSHRASSQPDFFEFYDRGVLSSVILKNNSLICMEQIPFCWIRNSNIIQLYYVPECRITTKFSKKKTHLAHVQSDRCTKLFYCLELLLQYFNVNVYCIRVAHYCAENFQSLRFFICFFVVCE